MPRPRAVTETAPFSSTARRRSRSCSRRGRSRRRRRPSGTRCAGGGCLRRRDVPQDRAGDRRLDSRGHRGRQGAEPSRSGEPPPYLGQPEHGRPGDARLHERRASRAGRDRARERLRRRRRSRCGRAPTSRSGAGSPRARSSSPTAAPPDEAVRAGAAASRSLDADHAWVTIQAPRGTAPQLAPYTPVTDIHGVDVYPVTLADLGAEPPRRRHVDEHDRVGHAESCGVDDPAGLCEWKL